MLFQGQFLGFNYDIELKDEQEFKVWLKQKLLRYVFNMYSNVVTEELKTTDSIELQVLKEILGIGLL